MFSNPKSIKTIAIFQIIGALIAFGYLVFFNEQVFKSSIHLLIFGFLFLVAILSFIGGIQLLRHKESGRIISIITQIIQLPYFSLSPILFYMGLCASAFIGIDMHIMELTHLKGSFNFQGGLGVDYLIEIGDVLERKFIGFNLVASVILIILFRAKLQPAYDS